MKVQQRYWGTIVNGLHRGRVEGSFFSQYGTALGFASLGQAKDVAEGFAVVRIQKKGYVNYVPQDCGMCFFNLTACGDA